MPNKSGRSRQIARIKAAKMDKARTFDGGPRGSKQSDTLRYEEYQSSVFHSASAALGKYKLLTDKGTQYVEQAQEYLRMLVYGPIVESRVARMHHDAIRVAEGRFATACWFKRRHSNGRTLPGMFTSSYTYDYEGARRAFPGR